MFNKFILQLSILLSLHYTLWFLRFLNIKLTKYQIKKHKMYILSVVYLNLLFENPYIKKNLF